MTVIKKGFSRMFFRVLEVQENKNNARSNASFSSACCDAKKYSELYFSIGSIFHDGLDTLDAYVNGKLPNERLPRKALGKLLTCINSKDFGGLQKLETDECDECAWAVQLAQHLLSKLAVGGKYTIDNHYKTNTLPSKGKDFLCPCGKRDKLVGTFGDTSFGCDELWHGNVDILMENMPVTLFPDTVEGNSGGRLLSESSDNGNDSSDEVKISEGFSGQDFSQMLSQCIVFSFLQKNQNEQLNNYLIPSLGISKSKVTAHFYDCENDVFLSSVPVGLYKTNGQPSIEVIVFLWLTLNYKWFCSGTTREMKQYSANFFKCAGASLGTYRNDVHRQVHIGTNEDLVQEDNEFRARLCLRDPDEVPKLTFNEMGSVLAASSGETANHDMDSEVDTQLPDSSNLTTSSGETENHDLDSEVDTQLPESSNLTTSGETENRDLDSEVDKQLPENARFKRSAPCDFCGPPLPKRSNLNDSPPHATGI